MLEPQSGIFNEGAGDHYFLEYTLRPGWARNTLCAALSLARESLPEGVELVLGFGPDCLRKLAPEEVPEYFIPFYPVIGETDLLAPGTQSDVFIWLMGKRRDLGMQAALSTHRLMCALATLELEVQGFRYLDSRDLGGFVDGTANPTRDEARAVALVPAGQAGAGGAFVLTQKWVHDLEAFGALDLHAQERIIGRTRADSVELEDAPPTAHIRRTDIDIDGYPLKIYRRSVPFGTLAEHGLYFLGFACEQMRFAMQLDRMFGCAEDGLVDALTGYSSPISGSYWFAPSAPALDRCLTA